jgi:hypothetical protein
VRRRPLPVDASAPPPELVSFRVDDWWAPELDPSPPLWFTDRSSGTLPHETKAESMGMWSAIHAFRRHQDAVLAWEAEHGKIREPRRSGLAYEPGWAELTGQQRDLEDDPGNHKGDNDQ